MPHTRATIGKMAKLARDASQSYPIRSLATRITHEVPSGDARGELAALYTWVRDHIRYRFDPEGLEWVQSPQRTVLERAGDCDDMTTLLAGLAGSLGHRWEFITVGPSANVQKHVAARAWDGREWVTLDPVLEIPLRSTTPRPNELGRFGDHPPGVMRRWDSEGRMLNGPVGPTGRRLWRAGGLGRPVTAAEAAYLWPHVAAFPYGGPAASGEANPVYSSAIVPGPRPARAPYPGALGAAAPPIDQLVAAGAPPGLIQGYQQWARAYVQERLRHKTKSGEWIARNRLDPRVARGDFGPEMAAMYRAGHRFHVRSRGPTLPSVQDIAQVALPVAAALIPGAGAVLAPIAAAVSAGSAIARGDAAGALRSGAAAAQGAGVSVPRLPGVPRIPSGSLEALKRAGRAVPVARAFAPAVVPRAAAYAPRPAAARSVLLNRIAEARRKKAAIVQQMRRSPWPSAFSGIRPSITFALGAVMSPTEYVKHGRTFAQLAGNAVAAHIKSRADKRPPGKPLPAVREFQLYDSRRGGAGLTGNALSVDGLWGSNTRAAAAYYLGVPVGSMPPTLPALTGAVTWQPPQSAGVAVAPAPKPAPKPAAPAAPRVVAVAPKPAAPRVVAVAPKAAAPAAPVITVTPAAARPVPVPRAMPAMPAAAVVPAVMPPVMSPIPTAPIAVLPGTNTPRVIDVDSPRRVAPPVLPAAPLPPPEPPEPVNLAPPPFPDDPSSAPGVPVGPEQKSDNTLVWLAVGYLWLRNRKRRS